MMAYGRSGLIVCAVLFCSQLATLAAAMPRSDKLINRVNGAGFAKLQLYERSRGSDMAGVAFSPVTSWDFDATMLLLTSSRQIDQRAKVATALGLEGEGGGSSADLIADILELRALARSAGVQEALKVWIDKRVQPAALKPFEALLGEPEMLNLESAGAAKTITNWVFDSSRHLLPRTPDDVGQLEPGFTDAVIADIFTFSAAARPVSRDYIVSGRGYYPGFGDPFGVSATGKYAVFRDFSGVDAIRFDGSNHCQIYVFSAPSRALLREFFKRITISKWDEIRNSFVPSNANAVVGLWERSELLQLLPREEAETSLQIGQSPFGPVLKSALSFDGADLSFASAGTISATRCCYDYRPGFLHPPALQFTPSGTGIIVEGESGLILFLGD